MAINAMERALHESKRVLLALKLIFTPLLIAIAGTVM